MERKNGLINLISGDDALQAIDIVRQMAVENGIGTNAQLLAKSGYQRWFDLVDGNIEQSNDGLRDS